MDDSNLKSELLHKLNQLIDERIAATEKSIVSVKESRDSDTKSSAGDKYETGRAMLQQELDKYEAQLSKFRILKNDLTLINPAKKFTQTEFGSLVISNQGNYFFSVALGKIELDDKNYFCLSMVSPIGQILLGKKAGDQVRFNGTTIVIDKLI